MANKRTKIEIPKSELDEIISLYESGISVNKLSKKYHLNEKVIIRVLKENLIEIRHKPKFSVENIDEIKKLYLDGNNSIIKISKIFNVSITPIHNILKKLNVLKEYDNIGNKGKIRLTNDIKNEIRRLYLVNELNSEDIGNILGFSKTFICKYIKTTDYQRSSSERVSRACVKRFNNISYDEYLKNLPEYKNYKYRVYILTRKQNLNLLENYNKRAKSGVIGGYHLDHKYSICEGFKNSISPEIISDIKNLEFIPWEENIKKRTNCSITLNELINK